MAKVKRLTKGEILLAEYRLEELVELQHRLWDKAAELEELLDVEISVIPDLWGYNLMAIRKGLATDAGNN